MATLSARGIRYPLVACLARIRIQKHASLQLSKVLGPTVNRRWLQAQSAPPATEEVANNGPLAGIRVLDLTRVLAGPYCTMMLGDLGADIIKVERPDGGDDTRSWKPPDINGESAYFLCVNRNKRSIAVDFKSPRGQALLRELAQQSDVVIENFIPGKLAEMGLDYPTLSAHHPGLVYCSITGYGPTGPYATRPGYDVIVSAVGGLMSTTGPEGGPPCKTGVALTDLLTGLQAYGGIMAALLARQKSGRGQKIDCSLLETQISSLVNLGSNYLTAGKEAKRWGTAHESIVPYQAFGTSNGHVLIAALNNAQFRQLCGAMGLDALASDPRYGDNARRVKHRTELLATLSSVFASKTTEQWLELLQPTSVACGPINTIAQALNDPQVLHRDMVREVHHPKAGPIKMLGIPVKFSENKPSIRTAPPLLGEHTDEVLRSVLGYSPEAIDALLREGVVA